MPAIKSVKAWKIAKSNGNCTVLVDVKLFGGTLVRAGVPSGPFTGFCEGLPLRDAGLGFMNGWIARSLIGKELTEATRFEHVMRLTGPFHEWRCGDMIGPGALLAVLLAVWKAGATVKKIPLYKYAAGFHNNTTLVLPVPAFNVINGSSHAINKLAMQEFMILPVGASCFEEAVKMGVEVYCHLKAVIKKKYEQDATNVGDEGGFAPNIRENKEGLKLLKTAIAEAGYIGKENKEGLKLLKTAIAEAGYIGKVVIGLDVPASEFYGYKDKEEDKSFVVDYPVVSILDPNEIGEAVQIVGDDLLVRNPKRRRVEKAIEEKSCNALLLKYAQLIGKKFGAEAIYAGVMVCATCEDRRAGSCSNLWWSPV